MSAPEATRPLDGVGSIKLKIGLLVGLSVVTAALVSEVGSSAGVPVWLTLPVTLGLALAVTQWLARGMTAPLREMTAAAARMATGDYAQRVTATSADEVGRLARAFNTMAVDLATADEQRRHLVATVSHELRTPLAGQRLLLENLVDGVVQPGDDSLATALAQAERLSDLVADLLDLARIDGGAAPLDLAPVAVGELVDRAVAEAELDARPVSYDVVVTPEGLTVMADGARLTQVVANLLDNAARHSPAGGTVTVHAAADGEHWSLTVIDEGPGIPAGQEQDVFARFGSAGPDDGGGGTGLGLAIASWVCEMHGGTIAALPAPPGTTGARVR
ncbi:MAG TPA: ATP-binding protein, partial [Phototrophicaceae bacterium]|nr:ATP-binding protein [Phototrophicaceae bacterium]